MIADFISVPVTNAFTSATLLIITGSQLKNLLGITYSSKGFVDSLYNLFVRIDNSKLGDGILAGCCCVFLLLFRVKKKQTTKQLFEHEYVSLISAIKIRQNEVQDHTWEKGYKLFVVS